MALTPRVGVGAIAGAIVTGVCEGEDTPASILLSPRSVERATAGRSLSVRQLPAVARRSDLTAIHSPHERARAIFEPVGGVLGIDDAFDALSTSTATIAAHVAYDKVYGPRQAAEAVAHMLSHHARGKVVIAVEQ